MKNLFKKMMLVAVAAMAFVACSQDNDAINATVKKTDVVFNLSIEDVTRAYFGEEQGSGSDTSFPSYWSGNESVTLVAYDTDDVVLSTAWGSIEAEGEQATQARVAATFNDDLTGVAKVCAYVGSWGYDEPRVPELSQEQYMEKEGTVASNAHTMSAEAAWDGVAQSIDLNFSHAVAYGRMQIKDLNDVTITKAIVKVDEAEYQIKLSSELDTKYIWFACDADDAIATLDIEVKASNGSSYVKTIDMTAAANPLKFRTGEVSKFAVSGLTEKGADYTLNLNKVVARTGNTITFQGDEEDDKWTVIFNEGLTEIAEGVYQGVHGAAWSNESALEYDYYNSNFYLAAVPAEYPYYADNAAINVSVEGGIYTISAFVTSYIGGPDKTVQISYVGDLTVEETYDSTHAYIYEGSVAYNDVTYMFVADDNRGLRIDFCAIIENNTIPAGTYTFSTNYGMYPNWCYYYANVSDYYTSKLDGGQAEVSVKDGQYKIVFTNMSKDGTVYVEQFTFKGELPGLNVPDPRAKLATPEVAYDVNEMTVSLSWKAIKGVEYYSVECDSEAISNFTTTETSATITLPEYGAYDFSVTAVVSENNENYLSSDAASVKVIVKDPNVWADYVLTSVAISGNYVTFQGANNSRVTAIFSKEDRIGDAIKLGDYTFVNSENPASGQFVTYMVTYDGVTKYSYQVGSGSMSVEEVNGEYKILFTIDGVRFGFIGTGVLGAPITDPVIIPSTEELSFIQTGGEKTIDLTTANLTEDIVVSSTNNHFTAVVSGNVLTVTAPENTVEQVQEATITLSANGVTATVAVSQDAYNPNATVEDGSETNPYSFKSANTTGWFVNFEDASNGDSLQMDLQTTDMRKWIEDNGSDVWFKISKLLYDGGGNIYTHNQNTYYMADYAGYSYIKMSRTNDGVYTIDLKMTVDGGATYTYYRYVGAVGGQQ